MDRFKYRRKERVDRAYDQQRDNRDDADVGNDFFHMECFPVFSADNQEVEAEVDAKEHHEHANDGLLQDRVIRKTIASYRESAGTGCSHRQRDQIKQRHAGQKQQNDLNQRQTKVDSI